jgi:hypothetical protein
MATAQFLSKQWLVGAVGYVYDQVTPDRGSAPILSPVLSRVLGAGPQIGYLFPINGMQGYLNFKAYFEFDHHDRADGWNTWLTFRFHRLRRRRQLQPHAPHEPDDLQIEREIASSCGTHRRLCWYADDRYTAILGKWHLGGTAELAENEF